MIIFPAVDIKDGQAVRLKKGRADEATIFSPDPVKAALHWQNLGATWLHLIDLDGAFTGEPVNLPLITTMCQTLSIPIQLGGGIRSLQTAKAYINAGIERLIIGTLALEDSRLFAEMCQMFPHKIGVSLDTEQGTIKTKGWVADSGLTLEEVLPELKKQGAAFLIHTDIDRDGMQTGVNLPLLNDLVSKSPIPLIAAGGVATLEDIKNLYPLSCQNNLPGNLQGVITGRAIYENTLDFSNALSWVANQK